MYRVRFGMALFVALKNDPRITRINTNRTRVERFHYRRHIAQTQYRLHFIYYSAPLLAPIKRAFHTSSATVKYVRVDHGCPYVFMS